MITAGFSTADISSVIHDGTRLRRPLEAVVAVFGDPAPTVALVALDLIEITPVYCAELQRHIAADTGLAADAVLVHTTHTHTAPWDRDRGGGMRLPGLAEALSGCVAAAVAAMRPCRMRVGCGDVGQSITIHRRGDTGTELGLQTFWVGYQFRDGDDRPDASALVAEMRSRWLRQPLDYTPGVQPVWFDRPVDPFVQAAVFNDLNGRPLGSMVRFCGHPHLANHCRERLYDPDYPGVVRDHVRSEMAAPCLFLLGPSANLVPKEHVRYVVDKRNVPTFPYMGPSSAFVAHNDAELLAEMERIGRTVAQAALDALRGAAAVEPASLRFAAGTVALPLDPALPATKGEADRLRAGLVAEYEAVLRRPGPLRELRGIANRLNWLAWAAPKALATLDPEDRRAGRVTLPVAALGLGRLTLAFMPSEIAIETTFALRELPGCAELWTVSLTGGSIEYIPTAEMIDEGGYEGRSTVVAREAEQMLREATARAVFRVHDGHQSDEPTRG